MKQLILWIMETRPQFLTLSIVLAFLGTSIAWHSGTINLGYAFLAGFGLMLTHGSVNAINDYFDYKSGIDLNVNRTPFSGGSGLVPEGKLPLNHALWVGVVTSLAAMVIGIFFIKVSGWQLAPASGCSGSDPGFIYTCNIKNPMARVVRGTGAGYTSCNGYLFYSDWYLRLDGDCRIDTERYTRAQSSFSQ